MPDDLLGLGKAAEALSKPLQDLLSKLLGPASTEAGELFADRIRYLRWKNSLSILEDVQKEIKRRKIQPQKIPLKTLVPILEGASLETNDDELRSKWINLLTNAASGDVTHPAYPKLLSEIIQPEAIILDYLYDLQAKLKLVNSEINSIRKESGEKDDRNKLSEKINERKVLSRGFKLAKAKEVLSLDKDFPNLIDNLLRLHLCEHPIDQSQAEVITEASMSSFHVTKSSKEMLDIDDLENLEIETDTETIETFAIDWTQIKLTVLGSKFVEACRSDINVPK
jgi:hypothetical protein